MRSITTCGMRACGQRRRSKRTTSAQSSGWIISSAGMPRPLAIGVSTKPGQIATARTPSASSSAFSDRVSEITAAFVGAVGRQPGRRERARDRGEVDDPAARLPQQRHRRLRDEEEPAQVDGELEVEVLRGSSSTVPAMPMPAELTSTSRRAEPLAVLRDEPLAVLRARRRRRDRRGTPSSSAAASTFSGRRDASVRSKPSSRSMRAIASPMPDEPPVTSAARPYAVLLSAGHPGGNRVLTLPRGASVLTLLLSPEAAAAAAAVSYSGGVDVADTHDLAPAAAARRSTRRRGSRSCCRVRPGRGGEPARRPLAGGRRGRLQARRRARARLHARLLPAARRRSRAVSAGSPRRTR